jgi:phytanoyl-CoA hydroxylase
LNLKAADNYFLTSTDKIRPFKESNSTLNDSTKENKVLFNKIGHALHSLNPVFKEVTFDTNVMDVYKSIGFVKPIICQSMYIFKQPHVGGEVSIHQDATFLHIEPIKLAGLWIALEDSTLQNGCLWFIPGSHKTQLTRRFIRNPNKEEFNAGKYLIYTDNMPEYDADQFVAAPVKAGN